MTIINDYRWFDKIFYLCLPFMRIFMWSPRYSTDKIEVNNETKVVAEFLHSLNFWQSRYGNHLWNQFFKGRMLPICIYLYLEFTFYALMLFTACNSGMRKRFINNSYHLKCALLCAHQIKVTRIENWKDRPLLRSAKILSSQRSLDVNDNFDQISLSHFKSKALSNIIAISEALTL